jgi:CheY-like chemotaxis protein
MQLRDATVLIVDDEPDLLDILADWFRREAHCVLVAANGKEALDAIEANQVDVVVSDVRMPVMDGIALLKNIKAGDLYRSSVMFISGFTDMEPRESYDLGVEAVMAKPVERKELMAVVTRVLAERAELWRLAPAGKAENTLDAVFDSLDSALHQRLLAFGRGGFCILSTRDFVVGGPIDLVLDFQADNRRVTGHGMIRWTALPDPEVGVEIMYIDDENRAWILGVTSLNESHSFIPRTTAIATVSELRVKV